MPRVRPGAATRRRHKRILRAAKGYFGARSKLFRVALPTVLRAGQYAFRDRRAKKREFRALWIIRISAACMMRGISYSQFMGGLKKAGVFLNRKMISEVAITDPTGFDQLVEISKRSAASAA
ncbi:MAG: 50S ribosomal protein L20 [Planctomycetota bacterium]